MKKAEPWVFYIAWFGLGLPIFLVMILLGAETGFSFEQIGTAFLTVILSLAFLAYIYLNKDVGFHELLKGIGLIILLGIFLGPTPVIIYLIYSFLF